MREVTWGTLWASQVAKDTWEPRIQAVSSVWNTVEKKSVSRGVRSSALVFCSPVELTELSRQAASHGLVIVVVSADAYRVRVAITRPGLAHEWHDAWAAQDNERIGELLGFPACCRAFFQRTFVDARQADTTLAMGREQGPPRGNILLRWLGVRMVPHLPCGFGCTQTANMAEVLSLLWPERELAWALEMLSWKMDYSSFHGIAEIRTPIFKFSTTTDYLPTEQHFTYRGDVPLLEVDARRWRDNGFSSPDSMNEAHSAMRAFLGPRPGTVLDLGAGNGELLSTLPGGGLGVEIDADRVSRGMTRHAGIKLIAAPIQSFCKEWQGPPFGTLLLMPGRLLEMSELEAESVRSSLSRLAQRMVLYSYDGQLSELAKKAKLTLGDIHLSAGLQIAEGVHDGNQS